MEILLYEQSCCFYDFGVSVTSHGIQNNNVDTKTTQIKEHYQNKNNINKPKTSAQDVGTKTILTQEQCCNKNIKGTGTQSAKQQLGYNNNVDTKTMQVQEHYQNKTTSAKQQDWHNMSAQKKCHQHKNMMAQKQRWHKEMLPKNVCTRIKQMTPSQSALTFIKLHNSMERVRVLNVKGGMCCLLYRTHRSSVACCSRNTKTIAGIYCGRVQIMPSLWPPLP